MNFAEKGEEMIEVISSELKAYHQQKLDEFSKQNQVLPRGGIVFAGDSIVEFFPLKKYLKTDLPLINRGIAGTDTIWLSQHLKEQIWILEPSMLFLWIGTNDLGEGLSISDIVQRISDMIAAIKQESFYTEIYLLSVLPVNERSIYQERVKIRNNKDIQALNQDLSVLSGAQYLDLYDLLLDDIGNLAEAYTIDGLHLTQSAYHIIAKRLTKLAL